MKNRSLKLYLMLAVAGCSLLCGACKDDDDLSSEAEIIISFKVKNTANEVYNAVINTDNTVTIKVSPYLDATTVLADAVPSFYLSKGATVSPDPSIPQNFAKSGGVKYTVTAEDQKTKREYTVGWGISDKMPEGTGFSYAEIGVSKNFDKLGYPGTQGDFGLADSKQYGDLIMYPAYCGNYIVLLSRAYIDADPTSSYGVKVFDKNTLAESGSLNLGSISLANLKLITSDYKGHCVGLVVSGGSTEVFYWTAPTSAPVSVGSIGINMASTTDGSANFQVAGDITGNAWITALAPRNASGEHYRVKVTGGHLASDYSTVSTGYSSSDCGGFQMISPLDDSDQPSYVIGDAEGSPSANNSIKCYVNSRAGSTVAVMPGLWQNILQAWWAGTGQVCARGTRRPIVSGMVINGKSYVAITSGTAWWHAATVMGTDLSTLSHENLNIAESVNSGWSYGSYLDWYWDEGEDTGYLAVWFGRLGLRTYKLTCFE